MEYFAGLDVSMEETHVCVVDRDGKIILEGNIRSCQRSTLTPLTTAEMPDASRSCKGRRRL